MKFVLLLLCFFSSVGGCLFSQKLTDEIHIVWVSRRTNSILHIRKDVLYVNIICEYPTKIEINLNIIDLLPNKNDNLTLCDIHWMGNDDVEGIRQFITVYEEMGIRINLQSSYLVDIKELLHTPTYPHSVSTINREYEWNDYFKTLYDMPMCRKLIYRKLDNLICQLI